jgi:transposase-like protein
VPYKAEKAGHIKPEDDKRVKLTDAQREEIRELYKLPDYSQRRLAGQFGVSRRLIQFIVDPEKQAAAKQAFAERQKDGRYYDKDTHTEQVREHRHRKHKLYQEGKLEPKEES